MLEIAKFVTGLASMLGRGFRNLSAVRADQRQRQSEYLDHVSEILAVTAAAVEAREDLTKPLSELRFHLENIGEVLRLGDPNYLMSMSDDTVERLQEALDDALQKTDPLIISPTKTTMSSEMWVNREKLKDALLNASGMFRGASVALRATDHGLT